MPNPLNTTYLLMAPAEFEQRRRAVIEARERGGSTAKENPRDACNIPGLASLITKYSAKSSTNASSASIEGAGSGIPRDPFIRVGRTAVLSVDAPIFFHASVWSCLFSCMTSPQIVRGLDSAAQDESIDRIALTIHSPGGDVAGMGDLVAAMNRAVAAKPVIALVNDMAASASYWMACKSSRIVATSSAVVGAIGAISVHYDTSAAAEKYGEKAVVITDTPHKAMGHWGVAIDEEMVERERKLLTSMAGDFRSQVSQSRGIPPEELLAMAGSMHYGPDALSLGLVDEVTDSLSFFLKIDAGEYDQYGPGKTEPESNTNTQTQPSGRSVAQLETRPMAGKTNEEKIAEMTEEEKDAKLAEFMDGKEETEEETKPSGSTEEKKPEASKEDPEEEPAASTVTQPAAMTFAKARSLVSPHDFDEATANKIVSDSVEHNHSETQILNSCILAAKEQGSSMKANLEQYGGGSRQAISGGRSGAGLENSAGSARANYEAAVKSEMDSNPGMTKQIASRNVAVNQPELAEAMNDEATATRKNS